MHIKERDHNKVLESNQVINLITSRKNVFQEIYKNSFKMLVL